MKVAITGAGGIIGRDLVTNMRRSGHFVRPIVRDFASNSDGSYAVCPDLVKETRLQSLVEGMDVVINLAAHKPGKRGQDAFELNARFPFRLAEVSRAAGARRFIQLSSAAAVGYAAANSMRPADDLAIERPINDYGRQKAEADRSLTALSADKFSVISIRPPAVYAPGQLGTFRPLFAAARRGIPLPFGAIDNARSMIYLSNLCDAIEVAAKSALQGVFILTDSPSISTPELYRTLLRIYGYGDRVWRLPRGILAPSLKVMLGRRANSIVGTAALDGQRFADRFGWRPPVQFEDALKRSANGTV